MSDVTPEQRAKWRKDAEQGTTFGATGDIRRILALLDALDAAETRVAAVGREACGGTHPVLTHPNGDRCIWLAGTGWFVPYDVGGEGVACPHDHPWEREALERAVQAIEALEGPDRIGTARWPIPDRDIYSLAVEEAAAAVRDLMPRKDGEAP